jgi:phosphomannomutase
MSADRNPDSSANEPLIAMVERWLQRDPDPDTVREVQALLQQKDFDGLGERFNARLAFGTAGLRGPLGAGPNRMNELLVRETAAGLADYLLANVPDAKERGVVVGYDARHKSNQFALATACVMAAKGIRTYLFPHVVPTPLVAFGVLDLGVAAGVQVTASHNPPADNGYKVYWGDGPQIVPPLDEGIAAAIQTVATSDSPVVLAPPENDLIEMLDEQIVDRYLAGVAGLDPRQSSATARAGLRIVYTALHGVGGVTVQLVFTSAGFTDFHVVAEQFAPDPDFPTVAFPNPEEKGALDLSLALAKKIGAHIVIANDPDADRMAAAIPDPLSNTGWRALRGDEIGWLLADHLLRCSPVAADKQLLVTTIVSSSLLRAMAAARGTVFVETLTGFKWLARAVLQRPELTNVLSYEEALGYCTGSLVLDKDGISAALVMADLAAYLAETGSSFVARLAAIEKEFGKHDTEQWSLRFDGPAANADMAAFMNTLRSDLPRDVAGVQVAAAEDLIDADPPSDVIILRLIDGSRIIVRPSGTEPKCKVYFETVTKVGATPPTSIVELKSALQKRFGLT